jgi:hypothetical protein
VASLSKIPIQRGRRKAAKRGSAAVSSQHSAFSQNISPQIPADGADLEERAQNAQLPQMKIQI